MMRMKLILLISVLLIEVYAAKLPVYLKKCKKGDDGTKCLIDNGQAAISALYEDGEPKFKLPNLIPLHIDKIDMQATPQLKLSLEDIDATGFKSITISDGHINDHELVFKYHMDKWQLLAKYEISGRILILPIQGKGDINITIVDFDYEYKTKLSTEERKGKTYYKVLNEDSQGTIISPKRVYWHLDNLFNGDERLGSEMNRFLDENWKDVFGEVKVAIEQASTYSVMNYFINGYLHFIPANELLES